jgi:hypothetical protein
MSVVFDPATQQYVNTPDPVRVRVPFLRQPVAAGDAVARMTQAIGVKPCEPCKERQARMNQRLVFNPWNT